MVTTNSTAVMKTARGFRVKARPVKPNLIGKLRGLVTIWKSKLKYLDFPSYKHCLNPRYGLTREPVCNSSYLYHGTTVDTELQAVRCLPVAMLSQVADVQPSSEYPTGTVQKHFLALSQSGKWLRLVSFHIPGQGYGELQLWWAEFEVDDILKCDPGLLRTISRVMERHVRGVIARKKRNLGALEKAYYVANALASHF